MQKTGEKIFGNGIQFVQKKKRIKAGGEWNSNWAEDRVKDVWEQNPIYAENMVKEEWHPN